MQDKLGKGSRKPRDRIITDAAFDYCIQELRGKARYFEKSGLIPTLDGPGNMIIKSDSLVDKSLHRDLNKACYTLLKDQEGNADWHPRNRSPFIQEEVVGVSNALDFMGEGKPIGSEYWSDKYQWLPANVRFREDGSAEFTSYVNNLHPTKFPDIYRTIERLVDRVIPAWDHCYWSDEKDDLWTPEFNVGEFLHKDVELTHQELRDLEEECYHESEDPVEIDEDEDQRRMNEGLPPLTPNVDDETMAEVKWLKYRDAILPDPKPFEEVDYAPKQSLREKFKKMVYNSLSRWRVLNPRLRSPSSPLEVGM
ncbi:uncharacterized protein FMAN_13879 [Fusarium mangiferae]|uniref:DUF4246 domain-containing protein n=1 Tax=Fusarium mangiferae TaxID=192010 RepID=A0A1L7TL01_FUSMA|nr:uncharacterized protein FMAN_13879 [Fusarium mangiferae]CVK95957.1 uncharacterized protein FMAN_13879 [Fusarium mangiferae]